MASSYSAASRVASRVEEVVALRVAKLRLDFLLPDGEGVGDVFEEDEAEDGVLVDGGVEAGAEAVGGGPELFVEVAEELLGVWVGHGRLPKAHAMMGPHGGRCSKKSGPDGFRTTNGTN